MSNGTHRRKQPFVKKDNEKLKEKVKEEKEEIDREEIESGGHRVCQVYSSAVPIAYDGLAKNNDWSILCPLVLQATYEATLAVGVIKILKRLRERIKLMIEQKEEGGGEEGEKGGGEEGEGQKQRQQQMETESSCSCNSISSSTSSSTSSSSRRRSSSGSYRLKVYLTKVGGGCL